MRISPLSETLGVAPTEIAALFAPFVTARPATNAAAWQRAVGRRRRKILKRLAAHPLSLRAESGRPAEEVEAEYARAWGESDHGRYDIAAAPPSDTPWLWGDQRLLASDIGATRWRQLLLVRAIERLKPRHVLEVGCGNGVNLILLAGRFPDIAFTGLELTAAGHRAACAFQEAHAELPAHLHAFAPLPLLDPTAFRRIRFVQANAAAMPFADGAFDLVLTVLALEQMERVRAAALRESARVAGRWTLMFEPFCEANSALWPRLNLRRRGYFQGRIADLPAFGLDPLWASQDFPQEYFLRAALVLSAKRGAAAIGDAPPPLL